MLSFGVIFLILVSSTIADSSYNVRDYAQKRYHAPQVELSMNAHDSRFKRDIRVHRLEDPDACIRNCSRSMHESLQAANETDNDEQAAKQLCSSLAPVESCYKSCPESLFRTLMLDFLPTMKVPCLLGPDKYSELKKNLDCLNSTDEAISSKCDKVCNSSLKGDVRMESRILLNVNPPFIMYDDDKAENTKMLKATCGYLNCEQKCGDPIAKEKCGQMAVDLDHKITTSVFGSIINLYKDLKALDSDLPECKAVM